MVQLQKNKQSKLKLLNAALTLCKSDFEKEIIEITEPFKLQQELIQTFPGCAK